MDIICILNDSNTNYIINNNEIIYKSQIINKNFSCKFSKIIESKKPMLTNYCSEIINGLKENSLTVPVSKKTQTIFLIGEHNNTFSKLVGKLIEEFAFESISFNFYIHEIKYNGVYDMVLNKFFDINLEKSNGFLKTKIFLDGFDKDINKKKIQIVDSIEKNIERKKDLTYIVCTFENYYNKITIYNLADIENIIDTENTNIVNYKNYFGLIDHNYIKSSLLNISIDKNKIEEESHLMNYFLNDIDGNFKVIYNLTKISPKTWELVSLFYDYACTKANTNNKNHMALVPFVEPSDIPKNYSLNSNIISQYKKSKNILKPKEVSPNNYKILNKPSPFELNNFSGNLVKYSNKHKLVSPILKEKTNPKPNKKSNGHYPDDESDETKIYSDKDVDKLVFELVKYIQKPQDPILTFDKLAIFNKFMFTQTVKTQLKLQKASKEPEKLHTINNEIICEMRALLTVMLDQINDL